ncbi:MAG: T9SS type A sorting domain-containing protein [Bacteroidales bacterium]
MKKTILLLILSTQLCFLFAQPQNISKTWGNSLKEENATDIFEVTNNVFFVASTREFTSPIIYRESIVLKLDSNCNVTDSLKLMNYLNRGKYYYISGFIHFNNRIIGYGGAIDTLTEKHNVWLSEFDENLTIIHDTLLGNPDSLDNLYTSQILITSQNKLLLTLGFVPVIHDTVFNGHDSINTMVWLIDSNFCILKENSIFFHFGFDGFSIIEMPSNQTFHLIAYYGITQIKQSDLSVDSVVWKPYDIFLGGLGAKAINDSIYLHPTVHPFNNIDDKYGMSTCIFIRDKNGKTKDSIFIRDMQKQYDKTSIDNLAFSTTDSIFVTGTNYSFDSNSYKCYEDNTIFLWNIKLNGQINWQKYYGIGKKFFVSDITKTSDGGCFLVGTVWDWHHYPEFTTDLFFLKIDKNGNISGSQGIKEIITQSEILLYPNPAKDYINFEMGMYKNFQLSVYNSVGQIVLQKEFTSGNNTIYIQNFKRGMYFYQLINNKGKVISGKFVKE